jgi:hypothetical protein
VLSVPLRRLAHHPGHPARSVLFCDRGAVQECMSTALLKRSLQDLEFPVGQGCLWSNIKPGPAFSPGIGGAAASAPYAAAAWVRCRVFEEAGVVDSVRSTAGPKNGQIPLSDCWQKSYSQVMRGAPGRIRTCAPASGGRVSPSTVVSLAL